MPVEMAGNAMDDSPNSSAARREPVTASARFASSSPSPQTGPTAWITDLGGSRPRVALILDHVPTAADNGPRHAASVLQMLVGRVDDGVRVFQRDVALGDLQGLAC